MRIPLIDLSLQHRPLLAAMRSAVARVLGSQRFVLGANGAEFEKHAARYLGVKHAIGLASGTDALFLSLLALGIGPGDEVLTTPFTFFATAGAISRTGAKPVFADIDARTFNLDVSHLASRVTSRTKAIIPVHLFGLPCDMKGILSLARKHSLAVVEDAAQSFGATYNGRQTGSLGDTGCYSFYPTKNLGGAGDGGLLTTSSDAVAEKIRLLRDHGSKKKYHHEMVGINSRLDEIQAAILLLKLKRIDSWNAARQRHAAAYDRGLKGSPVETPRVPAGRTSIYHLYSVLAERRDALAAHLAKKGIGSGVYYPLPLHLQPCYKNLGYKKGDFPVAEKVAGKILSLPMYAELKTTQVNEVVREVRAFYGVAK